MSETKNYFQVLNDINVSDKTEKKNNLTYLSWAWAWAELKKIYHNSQYRVYEKDDGRIYWDDGRTAWVKVSTTVEGIEHIEYLPVMDLRNASIPVDKVTSMDANKAIQRALTKSLARHGVGLYIYAGEDIPEAEKGKMDEGVLSDWLVKIEGAGTRDELKKIYHEAYGIAHGLKDQSAQDAILNATNKRKAQLPKEGA
jgi:hypothetical protein